MRRILFLFLTAASFPTFARTYDPIILSWKRIEYLNYLRLERASNLEALTIREGVLLKYRQLLQVRKDLYATSFLSEYVTGNAYEILKDQIYSDVSDGFVLKLNGLLDQAISSLEILAIEEAQLAPLVECARNNETFFQSIGGDFVGNAIVNGEFSSCRIGHLGNKSLGIVTKQLQALGNQTKILNNLILSGYQDQL